MPNFSIFLACRKCPTSYPRINIFFEKNEKLKIVVLKSMTFTTKS